MDSLILRIRSRKTSDTQPKDLRQMVLPSKAVHDLDKAEEDSRRRVPQLNLSQTHGIVTPFENSPPLIPTTTVDIPRFPNVLNNLPSLSNVP